jgi:transcriptional regulator with XRE-family HTH domain
VKEEEVLSNLLKRIGRKLTELRKKKGYTSHEDFAFDHDIPRVQYWRLEKGQTNLTMKSLIKLLTIHGLTAEEFFHTLYKESRK